MSRAWINFYMGDFQKKTTHLNALETGVYFLLLMECWTNGKIPIEPERRARIGKVSLKEWKQLAPTINPFFEDDGTNRRASEEIEKVENARTRRYLAAQKAGRASQLSQAIDKGRKAINSIQRDAQRSLNERSTIEPTDVERLTNAEQPNLDKNRENLSLAAREVRDEQGRIKSLQASPELLAILNGKTGR